MTTTIAATLNPLSVAFPSDGSCPPSFALSDIGILYSRHSRVSFIGRRLQSIKRRIRAVRAELPEAVPTTGGDDKNWNKVVRVVAVVGEGSVSPLKSATWEEVMIHTADRLKWVDDGYEMLVLSDEYLQMAEANTEYLEREVTQADLLVLVSVRNPKSIDWLQRRSQSVQNVFCFESYPNLHNKLGGSVVSTEVKENIFGNLFGMSKKVDESLEVVKTVSDAWDRYNSDDIRFCLLVIINAYVKPVPLLKNLRAKGLSTLNCMVKNCGSQVLNCLLDAKCRKALQCLNSCSPTDQVCSYRCIASYESPYLEAFSLCVLEKNNCLELDAEIPDKPCVPPLSTFRGENLSHEIAEDLFVGWLGTLNWSWRVVAGQNPAYDQFPCQYQLYYRGKARGSFWYEPVFKVKTFEGEFIWRRRKYRVKRAAVPGTFNFSVLDNGVVSREFWTIIDVSDDLSWALFYYKGAARAAGQSYTGAILVSPDGVYPPDMGGEKLAFALDKCGIKSWELYTVDNSSCGDAPLGIPEGSSLHSKTKACEFVASQLKSYRKFKEMKSEQMSERLRSMNQNRTVNQVEDYFFLKSFLLTLNCKSVIVSFFFNVQIS